MQKRKFPTLVTKVVACFSALKHIYTSCFAIAFYSLLIAISFVVHTNFSAFTCCCGKWYFIKVTFRNSKPTVDLISGTNAVFILL